VIDIPGNKADVITRMTAITTQQNFEAFCVNRLVYLESLRGISLKKSNIYIKTKAFLDNCKLYEIDQVIYDNTIEFSRFCKSKGITLKGGCEAIDFVHFMTAKYYELEILASDTDITEKLPSMYAEWQQAQS
jgi:hypothetical protein